MDNWLQNDNMASQLCYVIIHELRNWQSRAPLHLDSNQQLKVVTEQDILKYNNMIEGSIAKKCKRSKLNIENPFLSPTNLK